MNHIYCACSTSPLLMAYLSELMKATQAMSLGQTPYQLDWIRKRIGNGCANNRIGEVTWSYGNRTLNTMAYTGSVEIDTQTPQCNNIFPLEKETNPMTIP